MPRAHTIAPPGCPPLRAICFDNLGLIKVLENPADNGHPQVVARWGQPDSQRSILCASLSSEEYPVLAIARRNQIVEILNPRTGAPFTEINLSAVSAEEPAGNSESSRKIDNSETAGLHILKAGSFGKRSILTCTDDGNVSLRRIFPDEAELGGSPLTVHNEPTKIRDRWKVCCAGSVLCIRVDRSEKYAAFGGDGVDLNLWNLETKSKTWEAKAPRHDNTGLMLRPFVTASAFLGEDHRKLVVGTGHHQIRIYDVCAQRRPMLAVNFLESPIKVVEADLDGYNVFVGTGNGDLATFDMRTGKILGAFKGRCSGSIRSIARHLELPIIATCGLDRFLRVFHVRTRQLLTRVFLKQQLVAVVFDDKYPMSASSKINCAVADEVGADEPYVSELNGEEACVMDNDTHCNKRRRANKEEKIHEFISDKKKGREPPPQAIGHIFHSNKPKKVQQKEVKMMRERKKTKKKRGLTRVAEP